MKNQGRNGLKIDQISIAYRNQSIQIVQLLIGQFNFFLANIREFIDATRTQKTFESDDTLLYKLRKFVCIAGNNATPKSNVHTNFARRGLLLFE